MKRKCLISSLALMGLCSIAEAQNTSHDVAVTMGANGLSSYFVSEVSPVGEPVVTALGGGNANPLMRFEIGKRYRFNNSGFHPMAFLSTEGSETMLLRQFNSRIGTLESDASIDWFDDDVANFYFTMSNTLADALAGPGKTGRYRCENHGSMQGAIGFTPKATRLVLPTGSESFENAVLGANLTDAFAGWAIVGGGSNYTATITDGLSLAPGMHPDSTRWLTITDTDTTNSNRVYTPSMMFSGDNVGVHEFAFAFALESIAPGSTFLIVSQNFASPYQNTAGFEVTDTGVNLIILGSDEGGVGKAGPTVRTTLYNFGDDGGFGMCQWISVAYELDFAQQELRGHAIGSDGHSHMMETLGGLQLQAPADVNDFRWCIRNNAAGSSSKAHYDNLTVSASAAANSVGTSWLFYN